MREQARRLILEARQKSSSMNNEQNLNSPTSPNGRSNNCNLGMIGKERTISPIQNGIHELVKKEQSDSPAVISSENNQQHSQIENSSRNDNQRIKSDQEVNRNGDNKSYSTHRLSSDRCSNVTTGSSSLQSFNVVMEKISPKKVSVFCALSLRV